MPGYHDLHPGCYRVQVEGVEIVQNINEASGNRDACVCLKSLFVLLDMVSKIVYMSFEY